MDQQPEDYDTLANQLNDLLLDSIEANRSFVEYKIHSVKGLREAEVAYEAELRKCYEWKKHVRECEAIVIEQISADIPPIQLEETDQVGIPPPEDRPTEADLQRVAQHFSSPFMRR